MPDTQRDVVVDKAGAGRLVMSLLLLFVVPSFLFVFFKLSSLAPGLLLACMCILAINIRGLLGFRVSAAGILMFAFMFGGAFAFGAYAYLSAGESKSLISLLFFFVIAVAVLLGQSIVNYDFCIFNRALIFVLITLILLGWLKLFWQPSFLGYENYSKPVFPFSEESHYSLFLGIIACGVIVNLSVFASIFLILNMLVLAVLMPNLTLLLFSCICCFLFLLRIRLLYLWGVLIVALALLGCFLYFFLLENEYFKNRLDFSGADNLTALVFLQGWALAYSNFIGTSGFGLGFQMLGSNFTYLPEISEIIYRHAGQYFNVADAGFLAAKLIAELGVLGLLLSIFYLFLLFSVIFSMNYWLRRSSTLDSVEGVIVKNYVAVGGIVFGFLVEFFFRGLGYFSPGVFLFFVALTVYLKSRTFLRRI
ncbi:hypothetical protein [Pseudomonas sp. HLMP]|uniref:hypothetical protein n=1 Tax=Pseudomonas sp. HLMP TaxID=3153767 RepID=UPI003966F065